jgi:hypothetical protein
MTRKGLLAVAIAAVVSTSACAQVSGGSGGGSGSVTVIGGSGGGSGGTGGGGESPKPSVGKGGSGSGGSSDAKGDADVAIAGSDHVNCDTISADVQVTARDGKAAWTASAKRSPDFADRLLAQGVSVSPASGTTDEGRSSTVHVRGSFDRTNKYFYVTVVSRENTTSHSVEFTCR